MKVVLFCGGQGMRIREFSGGLPKPMVTVGYRPILWHIMKYYAHFGHKDFLLCLGHQGDVIKNYFRHYDETVSNDFVLTEGNKVELLTSDIHDWRITFVDTGLEANVGERLQAIRPYLGDDALFLANYADGVSDVHLPSLIDFHKRHGKIATFVSVHPNYTSHVIAAEADGTVMDILHVTKVGMRINGGFFVFDQRLFDYMKRGEDLLEGTFQRLMADRQLVSYNYDGFWACMDTFKERQTLEDLHKNGPAPWEVWHVPPKPAPVYPLHGDGAMMPLIHTLAPLKDR